MDINFSKFKKTNICVFLLSSILIFSFVIPPIAVKALDVSDAISMGSNKLEETRGYADATTKAAAGALDWFKNSDIGKKIIATSPDVANKVNEATSLIADTQKKVDGAKRQIQTLAQLENFCGGAPDASCITKGINTISGLSNDLKALTSGGGDVSTKIKAVQGILTKLSVFSPGLQEISGSLGSVGSVLSGFDGTAMSAVGAAEKFMSSVSSGGTGIPEFNALTTGIKSDATNIASSGAANDLFKQTTDVKNFEATKTADMKKVCDPEGQSLNQSGGGGSNGVPVIEQPGELLSNTGYIVKNTGSLVDLTTRIKGISQKTCEYTKEILEIQTKWWNKVEKLDPKAARDAKDAVTKEAGDYEKFMKTGGKPSDNLNSEGQTIAPTINMIRDQEAKAGRNDYLKQLKESNVPEKIKTQLLSVFEKQIAIENEDGSSYKAATAGTEGFDADSFINNPPIDNPSAYWEGFMTLAEPRNNISGQYILQLSEKNKIVGKYIDNAEKTWQTYQIMPRYEKCLKEVEYNGTKTCAEWEIKTPAKLVADTASTLNDSKVNMTIATDQYGEEDNKKSVDGITNKVSGASANEITIGPDDVAIEKPKGSDFSEIFATICQNLPELSLCSGNINDNDTNEQQIATTLAPTLVMTNEGEVDYGNGLKKTTFSWSSADAISCVTDTKWVTYSTNGIATTTPKIIYEISDDLEMNGRFEVFHPAIFTYSVSASGPTHSVTQTAENSFSLINGYLTQTLTYKPNISGLLSSDTIFLWLNNMSSSVASILNTNIDDYYYYTQPRPTATDITARLKTALESAGQNTTKGIEFSKYNKSTAFDALILSRNAPEIKTNYNTYGMTCYNKEGSSVSRDLSVVFFK